MEFSVRTLKSTVVLSLMVDSSSGERNLPLVAESSLGEIKVLLVQRCSPKSKIEDSKSSWMMSYDWLTPFMDLYIYQ